MAEDGREGGAPVVGMEPTDEGSTGRATQGGRSARCFVISPIGTEHSKAREHADDVFDFIIKPAMDECGIEVFRSDHLLEPGKISEQMFDELVHDDLCVALLTGNPNVFYELAIAQASQRPVIILLEKGHELPFDIQDLRCVYYDLKPRPLFERVYVDEIIGHVRGLQARGWRAPPLFEHGLSDVVTAPEYITHAMDYGTPEDWARLVEDAETVFDLAGISLSSWRRDEEGFAQQLRTKAAAGCKVRIMVVHPDNPVLPHLINAAIAEEDTATTQQELESMGTYFAGIAASHPNIEVRQIRTGYPYCNIIRSDTHAVYIPYLFATRSNRSPLWKCGTESPLYQTVTDEFEAMWEANSQVELATATSG